MNLPARINTTDDVLTLIQGQSRTSATGLRNRALIALLWRSGLRVGCEALKLQIADLNFGAATIHVRKGKNSKARIAIMDPFGWDHLTPWLAARGKLEGVDAHSGIVFCTIARPVTGGPLAASSVRKMLRDTADAAGLARRVTPHTFRHTMAAGMFDEGTDLRVISRQLGHANIAITDTYVNHLPTATMVAAISERPRPGADVAEEASVNAS